MRPLSAMGRILNDKPKADAPEIDLRDLIQSLARYREPNRQRSVCRWAVWLPIGRNGEFGTSPFFGRIPIHAGALANVPVNRITTEQVADTLRPIWNGPGNNRGNRLRRLIESKSTAKRVEPNPGSLSAQ